MMNQPKTTQEQPTTSQLSAVIDRLRLQGKLPSPQKLMSVLNPLKKEYQQKLRAAQSA